MPSAQNQIDWNNKWRKQDEHVIISGVRAPLNGLRTSYNFEQQKDTVSFSPRGHRSGTLRAWLSGNEPEPLPHPTRTPEEAEQLYKKIEVFRL